MGVDLTLLVVDGDTPGNAYSHTVLRIMPFVARAGLWDRIRALPSTPIEKLACYMAPEHTETCEEAGYGDISKDCYGKDLRCVRAGDLAKLATHRGVRAEPLSIAIWAYLAAAPPDTRVALYWD